MGSSHTDDQALIPIGEAARILGMSISTLRRWDREGHLKPVRLAPGGTRRYRRSDIDALIEAAS